jgi:hypothetical protein
LFEKCATTIEVAISNTQPMSLKPIQAALAGNKKVKIIEQSSLTAFPEIWLA